MRLLTADTHPDRDTLCPFRRENQALPNESFVKVLQLAQQLNVLKFGQFTVAADGTTALANASKHSAVFDAVPNPVSTTAPVATTTRLPSVLSHVRQAWLDDRDSRRGIGRLK